MPDLLLSKREEDQEYRDRYAHYSNHSKPRQRTAFKVPVRDPTYAHERPDHKIGRTEKCLAQCKTSKSVGPLTERSPRCVGCRCRPIYSDD